MSVDRAASDRVRYFVVFPPGYCDFIYGPSLDRIYFNCTQIFYRAPLLSSQLMDLPRLAFFQIVHANVKTFERVYRDGRKESDPRQIRKLRQK